MLSVVPLGEVRPVPFLHTDLNALEVSVGPSPTLRLGIVLAGVAAGLGLGASGQFESSRCRVVGAADPECVWLTSPALVGAGGGFMISALAARFLVPERWRVVRFWF